MARKLYRPHKRNFTAGELGDILHEKIDFSRFINGCHEMLNMTALPQGPATRRSGTKFLYNLTSLLGGAVTNVRPRLIPFVFSRSQAYALLFFKHNNGNTRVAFVTSSGLVESSTPGVPYVFEFSGTLDIWSMDYSQMNDFVKLAQPNRKPLDFKRLAHNSWSATEVAFTSMPTGASGWSDPDNWPSKVGFFEQRICYAATKNRPQTLWFSKSANFEDMGVSSPIVADDAVTLTMNSGSQNAIAWMNTARALLVGTLGDEWDIKGSGSEPLSFKSFKMNRHTRQGSEPLKPIMIGPVTIFVELLGRVVNQFVYDYATDSYDVVDLSVLAPHLTAKNKIVDWTYQKTPHGIIWAVRDDGILIALTMKREHNVIGWHRHTTDGKFLAVTAIPGSNETDLFCVVERTIGGVTKWYVEMKAPQFDSNSAIDGRFLDSFLEYSGTPISTVTGLGHLEGKTVSILAGGRPHTSQVVTGGSITLDRNFNYIVVGLPFTSRLIPTSNAVTLEDGNSHSMETRVISSKISLKDSSGMRVGIQNAFGKIRYTYVPFLNPLVQDDEPIPLATRFIPVDFTESDTNPEASMIQRVVIEQDLPLPLTVLGTTDLLYISEI